MAVMNKRTISRWFEKIPTALNAAICCLPFLLVLPSNNVAAPPVTALPIGGNIVSGEGNITSNGAGMTIHQSSGKLIAEWDSFNIGQQARVHFQQPTRSSIALNRVLSMDGSQIFGTLSANGQVFLINPAGVTFGPTASFSGAGLLASTLDISNSDFNSNNFRFENGGQRGLIENAGRLSADGGYIALLSPYIVNSGTIQADGGTVALVTADKVSLDFVGDKLIHFVVDQGAVDAQIDNGGLIQADDGVVVLSAEAKNQLTRSVVNNSGVVHARGVIAEGGRILLTAEGGISPSPAPWMPLHPWLKADASLPLAIMLSSKAAPI